MDSTILKPTLFSKLKNLCKSEIAKKPAIDIKNKKLKLLYRGSRDGFGSSDFHSKCDGHSNTITMIETTKGYVFGGYTSVSWSSKEVYFSDSNAFLFSLVNKFNHPFLCKVLDEAYSIDCSSDYGPDYGPDFGESDIHITNNSNISNDSSGIFRSYSKPADLNAPNGIYFTDEKNFQVKEIEVFQKE